MSRQDDLEKELELWQRRLQKRREQKALFGASADPSIDLEIEDIEAEIARLQAQLEELERTAEPPAQPKQTATPPAPPPAEPAPQRAALRARPPIFLCHANEDKPQVMELYHRLQAAGYRPWLDKFDLLPGQDWEFEIRRVIREADFFLACLSKNSTDKRGYVQKEIKIGLDILDQMPEGKIYLIPVRLEACAVPERLRSRHWVDLFEPDGFEYLTRALDYEIGKRQEAPKPEPVAPAKTPSARSPEPKPAPTKPPQRPSPPPPHKPKPLSQKLLQLARDPIWQMLGVLVAIIGIAWPVYTYYAGIFPATPTSTPTITIQPITASDGAPMVLVPAGPFEMGSENGNDDEKPLHTVTLDVFYIDQYETTNEQFVAFLTAQGNQGEDGVTWYNPKFGQIAEQGRTWQIASGFDKHPVTGVSWYGAKAYCAWRGDRLPTEAEWEKAARGTDGRTYPWGDKPPNATLLNFSTNIGDTTSVGSYPDGVSPYGAYDMAGNVWEWTSSLYEAYPYQADDGRENLDSTNDRVLRGGSWYSNGYYARAPDRNNDDPGSLFFSIGFRCVR